MLSRLLLIPLLHPPSTAPTHPPPPPPTAQLLYQSSTSQNFENLAVRPNGHLVLTVANEPSIYALDPNARIPSPTLLHRFPNAVGTIGIVETTAPDVFAVVAGNYSNVTLEAVQGSFAVWEVDFNGQEPKVRLVAKIPEAGGLNGMARLDDDDDTAGVVLVADSVLGAVWRVDVATGEYRIAVQSPFFTNGGSEVPLGINGVRTFEGMLYFTNSALGIYGRVDFTNDGGTAGEVQILGRVEVPAAIYDDFDIDREGNAWIATHPDLLLEVTSEGEQRNITGDNYITDLVQPTSVRFGRGFHQEENTLYVVTAGSGTVGGQFIAVSGVF